MSSSRRCPLSHLNLSHCQLAMPAVGREREIGEERRQRKKKCREGEREEGVWVWRGGCEEEGVTFHSNKFQGRT